MKKFVITAVAILSIVSLTAIAQAATITTFVSGKSGPWDVSLNPTYSYGVFANGQNNFNLAPTIVSNTSGIAFVSGDALTIANTTPGVANLLAGAGGTLYSDANGVTWWGADTSLNSPAHYISGYNTTNPIYLEELLGVFAFNGVIVGNPFAIGNGPVTAYIPNGANQLMLGVNDGWYNDNGAGTFVSITEVSTAAPVPEPGTMALLGLGMAGLAIYGKRRQHKS